LRVAAALCSRSQRTLPSTAASRRIHTSNASGVILAGLLKQQNTKAFSGRPASARLGVRWAIGLFESFAQ
jgi:hypothetical protein